MQGSPPSSTGSPRTSGLAIWSLVLGLLGFVLLPVCFPCGLPAVVCGHFARSRIRKSGGMITGEGLALGGLITGYLSIALIPVLALLAAIAVPNFLKARQTAQRNACVNNLRLIDRAKEQWSVENRKQLGAPVSETDLRRHLRDGVWPVCPAGGRYRVNPVGANPTCTVPGHAL
jgi:hypothetical protein